MTLLDDPELGLGSGGPSEDDAPAHLTKQSAAAWYFSRMAGDRVRYDHGRGRWLIWAGHRWQPDEDGTIERLWLETLADRYRLALHADDRQHALAEVQTAGATNAAVTAGLELASIMLPIATRADAWDPDPHLLCCNNGVVELRTGELRDGRPEDMISRSTLVNFDPAAKCPRFDRFLREVFADDQELVDWFELLIGAALVGKSEELLAVWHGKGNNGKSVTLKTLRAAFGEYAVEIAIETLVNSHRRAGEATPDLMTLRGARIAFAKEPDKAAKLEGGTLKRLVSIDQMTGRGLYGAPASWEPTHSLILATNHLPAADDATDAFWRRIALVPWPVHFAKPGEDGPPEEEHLGESLAGEASGILSWAVRGAVAFAAGRSLWPFPEAVQVKTQAYRADEDQLGGFLAGRLVFEKGASVPLKELHAAYLAWCETEGVPEKERFKRTAFGAYFEERDQRIRRFTNKEKVYFAGAQLARDGGISGSSGSTSHFAEFPRELREIESYANSPLLPLLPLIDSETIVCSDYSGHQFNHRRDGSGFVCDICSGATA